MDKGLKGFWKNFESTMSGLGKALEEELDGLESKMKSTFEGTTSVSNTNGDIVITGDVKSLTINGEKINLKKEK